MSLRRWMRVSPVIVLSIAAGLWIGACFQTPVTPPAPIAHADELPAAQLPTVTMPDFSTLAAKVMPAVVSILVYKTMPEQTNRGGQGLPEQLRPFFPWLFQQPNPHRNTKQKKSERLVPTSAGSGFIISEDGYIVTNHHVVDGGEKVEVQIGEDETYIATIVGSDAKVDLALLKIKGKRKFTALAFGNVDNLRIGNWVLAIGNPFRLKHTVTAGIVSAKERNIGRGNYDNYIQTDASINPGNSGGPLVNMRGEVVGINTAIITRTGESAGIGMAIPADMAQNIITQLRETGKVSRGWLGVQIQKVTPMIATGLGLKKPRGALVAMVTPDSPAKDAGLATGDVIVTLNGKGIHDFHELPIKISQMRPGTTVHLSLVRNGKTLKKTVKLGTMPSDAELADRRKEAVKSATILGMTVRDVTAADIEQLNIKYPIGALVTEIQSGSPAEYAGVQAGDVVRSVKYNGQSKDVRTADQLRKGVKEALSTKAEVVVIVVIRDSNRMLLALEPETR